MRRAITLSLLAMAVAGCATPRTVRAIQGTEQLELDSFDGRPAGARGFSIRFAADGSYAASYGCSEHFGTYTDNSVLSLQPGASSLGDCDAVNLTNGRAIDTPRSYAEDFFADPRFTATRRGAVVTLTNGAHRFGFRMVPQ